MLSQNPSLQDALLNTVNDDGTLKLFSHSVGKNNIHKTILTQAEFLDLLYYARDLLLKGKV